MGLKLRNFFSVRAVLRISLALFCIASTSRWIKSPLFEDYICHKMVLYTCDDKELKNSTLNQTLNKSQDTEETLEQQMKYAHEDRGLVTLRVVYQEGSDDVRFQATLPHQHSMPLKYYLEQAIVIDHRFTFHGVDYPYWGTYVIAINGAYRNESAHKYWLIDDEFGRGIPKGVSTFLPQRGRMLTFKLIDIRRGEHGINDNYESVC